jgi:hypothetical protein
MPGALRKTRTILCGFCAKRLLLFEAEFFVELLNAAARIHELLLARIKGVTLRANFDLDIAPCAARLNHFPASAPNRRLLIVGMDSFLHPVSPLSIFQK